MAYASYTLADVQTLLKLKWETVPFWTDAEATNAINEALLMWNLATGYWRTSVSITTTKNNFDYGLPASLVFGTRVMFNNIPLAQSSMDEMNWGRPGWQSQTTADFVSPTSPQIWLPLSIDMIAIWPIDALGGNTLKVDGVAQTPRLVNSTDVLDLGNESLNAILGYALHVATLKEGGERFDRTMPFLTGFFKAAVLENDTLMASQMFRTFIGTDQSRQTTPDVIQTGGRA